jgi:3-methylcrotonyl-CoA carboxylase alpha subunit
MADFPDEVVRVETGVEQGDSISPYYDPMIAKLVAAGNDRDDAMMNLAAALYALRIWPVKTNAAFLLSCLQDADFRAGKVTTGLIAQKGDELTKPPELGPNEWMLAALQMFAPYYQKGQEPGAGPWTSDFGFRLNAPTQARIAVQHGAERRTLALEDCVSASGFSAAIEGGALVYKNAQPFLFTGDARGSGTSHGIHDGEIEAPMPGKVTAVEIKQGEKVIEGQRLLTLEAMKMEHALTAPFEGVITELNARPGVQVTEGTLLVKVEAEPSKA